MQRFIAIQWPQGDAMRIRKKFTQRKKFTPRARRPKEEQAKEHIIVGFAPAGANDISARLIGQWLSERLGRELVIENRPGAASNLATEARERMADALAAYQGPITKCPPGSARDKALSASARVAKGPSRPS
jgi:hypothetical protein